MAHCINCDKLISDNPDRGDFCDEVCEREYEAGADQQRLEAAKQQDAHAPKLLTNESTGDSKHTTAPDVKTFLNGLVNTSTHKG